MKINRLDYQDHVFRFTDGEYVMSHVTQYQLDVRVLRLETADGHVGWGEIARKPLLDPAMVAPREEPLIAALVGQEVAQIPVHARNLAADDKVFRGLAFGLETAYLDLVSRREGLPLYAILGGKRVDHVPEYYSLSCIDGDAVAQKLTAEATGWDVVQVKLGTDDRDADIHRLRAALDTLSSRQKILADFNGALDVDESLAIISRFDDERIIWEEPCNSVEMNTQVARRSSRPVMFDQCLENMDIITGVIADGHAHSVCIKPAFQGGLEAARAARDMCIDAGMLMRIDGPWCGHIATAVCLHLAVGAPADLLIAGCDLRQPLVLDEDWGGTRHLPGHRIAPTDTPGHGAVPPA